MDKKEILKVLQKKTYKRLILELIVYTSVFLPLSSYPGMFTLKTFHIRSIHFNQIWPLSAKVKVGGSLVYSAIALPNKNVKYTE